MNENSDIIPKENDDPGPQDMGHDDSIPGGEALGSEDQTAFRTLPHNIEAEKALLGAIFSDNRAYERVSEFLRAEHFAIPENGIIFEAIQKRLENGQVADPITLFRVFEGNDDLKTMGGAVYLAELAASAVTIINAGEYGRTIHDLHLRRTLIAIGQAMTNRAYEHSDEDPTKAQIEDVESALAEMGGEGSNESMKVLRDIMGAALDEIEEAKRRGTSGGLSTGLIDVDAELGGLEGGDFMLLAGGTSMGKTAEAVGIALHNAEKYVETGGSEGAVVMFSSLEMSGTQLAKRILSVNSGISSHALRRGNVTNWEKLISSARKSDDLPFYIDETAGSTVQGIRRRARRLKRKKGLGLLIIDYLQLINPGGKYAGQRVNEVGEISRKIKELAKELDVPIIALSQLSRQVDQRDDHRPRKSDLRESGSLEQDADTIIFMFRPEYYTAQLKPVKRLDEDDEKYYLRKAKWEDLLESQHGQAEVIIAKNRHGPAGKSVDVYFDALRMAFENLARE